MQRLGSRSLRQRLIFSTRNPPPQLDINEQPQPPARDKECDHAQHRWTAAAEDRAMGATARSRATCGCTASGDNSDGNRMGGVAGVRTPVKFAYAGR